MCMKQDGKYRSSCQDWLSYLWPLTLLALHLPSLWLKFIAVAAKEATTKTIIKTVVVFLNLIDLYIVIHYVPNIKPAKYPLSNTPKFNLS